MNLNPIRLPAEWEPQSAVMLTWPHPQSDWLPILDEANKTYLEITRKILNYADVLIVAHPENKAEIDQAVNTLNHQSPHFRAYTYAIASDDTWSRDHGPLCVLNHDKPQLLDFEFNGWGNKYPSGQDNLINQNLKAQNAFGDTTLLPHAFVLEGGAIESNGEGCLLTTSACLLNPNRNPTLTKAQIESQLTNQLGASKVLWLDHGYLAGDDTDSHIDTLARFAPDNTIVYVTCNDKNDEHFSALQAMETQLRQLTNQNNEPFRLIPLPWPDAIYDAQQARLPATYANFLICNKAVLLPVYGVKQDPLAIKQLQLAFPDHDICPINCRTLIQQHGSLHCITMQLPTGSVSLKESHQNEI